MDRKLRYEDLEVGQKIGTMEFTTNDEDIEDFLDLVQWSQEIKQHEESFVPPSFGVSGNVRLLHEFLGGAGSGVWAKSEHKYFNVPIPGKRLLKHGEIADKYIKRGKKYLVWKTETTDEDGRLIYQSRETSVWSLEERVEK
jgi:hypothetical protein